jgi:hypothetical protein
MIRALLVGASVGLTGVTGLRSSTSTDDQSSGNLVATLVINRGSTADATMPAEVGTDSVTGRPAS